MHGAWGKKNCLKLNKRIFLVLIFPGGAIYVKGMVGWFEIIKLTCVFDYFINPGIAEFNDFTCFHINQVVVLHAMIRLFKLGNIFPKLMLDNKV